MSWSITLIGTPVNINAALDAESEKLTGMSKTEFDDAKPHLQQLCLQNTCENQPDRAIKLSANGHGSMRDGKWEYRNCNVSIEGVGRVV